MMSLWDALRMNMMISYQELVRTFPYAGITLTYLFIILQPACRAPLSELKSVQQNEGFKMTKKTAHSQITKTQIYRSVASSTAIETGVSVQKIEQQLKQNQAQAKAVGLAR